METSIKQSLRALGADICGIAALERFGQAPPGFAPTDIFPDCRSVVVFAKKMPRGTGLVAPRIIYNKANDINTFEVDRIAFLGALEIERLGGVAVPLPADSPYEYWEPENLTGKGILSMRHAAVQAGLGSLGKNTLLLNKTCGNMITIGAVLTDLQLESDPLADEVCLPGCRRCLDACPQQALQGGRTDQKLCRPHTYGSNARGFSVVNCNTCRTVCPLRFGEIHKGRAKRG